MMRADHDLSSLSPEQSFRSFAALIVSLLLVGIAGCTYVPYTPPSVRIYVPPGDLQGNASWYGRAFHGRSTSSGERFDMNGFTAAHRTLPFGSLVRVQRIDTGVNVDVRINDRGPFVEGRVIDVSRGAAVQLGMLSDGVVPVRLIPIRVPPVRSSEWSIVVGGFSDLEQARSTAAMVRRRTGKTRIVRGWNGDPSHFHLRLFGFWNKDNASQVTAFLRRKGYSAFMVRTE